MKVEFNPLINCDDDGIRLFGYPPVSSTAKLIVALLTGGTSYPMGYQVTR
jgi:hypothetical protein